MKLQITLIAACCVVASICAGASAQEQVQAPVYKEGSYWRFRGATKQSISSSSDRLDGEYEVVFSGGALKAFRLRGGERVEISPEREAELKRMLGAGQDERQYLKFPLEGKRKWEASYECFVPGSLRPRHKTVEYKLIVPEERTTPAGNFRTIRIEGDAVVSSPFSTYSQKYIYFYSKEVGAIVDWYYDSNVGGDGAKQEIKLIKFKLAK